ncbi:hypothetical protein UPYG_G00224910 [Umbra pygmaea]|uniref:Glutamate-rich protein 1 n=1 Tax=Umbra pygmaea TaxID=75934 RepID=A0ABD0X033_UMBPY
MAYRKEVFQSKVLQRLYPLTSKPDKEPSHPPLELMKTSSLVQENNTTVGDRVITVSSHQPRRVYTVLAPPEEYKTGAEGSVTLSQPSGINTEENPADDITRQSNENGDEEVAKCSRRRRKRKGTKASGKGTAADRVGQATDSIPGERNQALTPTEEDRELISKNKKRKLKKKRHKEKLLSLGLVPRAAALEFTYQREAEEEPMEEEEEPKEEEGEEEVEEEMRHKRAAEMTEFLRKTHEIYMSDHSLSVAGRLHVSSAAVEALLNCLANGTVPPAGLAQLHSLKSLMQQRDEAGLLRALQELQNASDLSPEETTTVVLLFHYWITDILPLRETGRQASL